MLINGNESKEIRNTLGLSQRVLAEETGINKTDLSRFENGHLILRNDLVDTLIEYFESKGADLSMYTDPNPEQEPSQKPANVPNPALSDLTQKAVPETKQPSLAPAPVPGNQSPVKPTQYHIDGILIPESFPAEEAEALMDEYQTNKVRIKTFLSKPVPRGFWGDIHMEEVMRNVLVPMAENFAIIDHIHGDTRLAHWETIDDTKIHNDRLISSYQDAVEHLFTTPYSA